MNLKTERLPDHLGPLSVSLFDVLEESSDQWIETKQLIDEKLKLCTRYLEKDPHNEILKHNHEILLLMGMSYSMGCFL